MYVRLYSGKDGQSHFEEFDLPSQPADEAPLQSASGISFRHFEPGVFRDWHPTSRRLYLIMLSGYLEIGIGDGTTKRLGPGDVQLAEDLEGQGHTGTVVGDDPAVFAVVPLG